MGLLRAIPLVLPTLCLLYSWSWASDPAPRGYLESFLDADHYLWLTLEVNPEGVFQRRADEGRVHFSGAMVFTGGEYPLHGFRLRHNGKRFYRFTLGASHRGPTRYAGAEFFGELRPGRAGCAPELHYRLRAADGTRERGVLRATFCYR